MVEEKVYSVEDWVDFLGKEHMPALAETIQKLNRLTTDDDSRVSQLTEQILKDPSITTRVLQISNSVAYKGFGGNIKTITRAIVMLGFTTIRDIALSMQILDNILKHNPSEALMNQIANSFHAAVQARGLLREAKSEAQEEIFISTLLLHFAELSMLARDDEISRKLNYLLAQNGNNVEQAAQEVLGCKFQDLSLCLAKQWDLGDILIEALNKPKLPSKPAQAVLLGDELSQVAPMGWNTEAVQDVVKKIAKYRNLTFKQAMAEVQEMAQKAQDLAVHYGATKVKHLIPSADQAPKSKIQVAGSDISKPESMPVAALGTAAAHSKVNITTLENAGNQGTEFPPGSMAEEGIEDLIEMALSGNSTGTTGLKIETDPEPGKPEPYSGVSDFQLQMDIMNQLNKLIADKRMNVNEMLNLVLEGMTSALGLDRIVMALLSRDRKKLVPKFFKGDMEPSFKEAFKITLNEENVFTATITQSQQFWIGSKLMAGRYYLHTKQVQDAVKINEYFVAPIIVARRPIGVFYGDQFTKKTALNDQQYAGFTMLAQQAGLALTAVQN